MGDSKVTGASCTSCAPGAERGRDSSAPVMLELGESRQLGRGSRRALAVAVAAGLALASVGVLLFSFAASQPYALRTEPVITRIVSPTVDPAVASDLGGIDEAALVVSLGRVERALWLCSVWAPPTGWGKVVVTIDPSGRPSSVEIEPSAIAGSEVGRCVERAFQELVVPPFEGSAVTVRRGFHIR